VPRGVIRPLVPAGAEELAAIYRTNRDFLRPFEPTRREEFFTADVQRQRIEGAAGDRSRWAIEADGRIAGVISLGDVLRESLQLANVGYFVAQEFNGRGLATRALADVVRFAFGDAGLHRLEAGTLPDNHASQRVLEKNGFVQYGLARARC
jgi:ribosomal-protein-alanine N-acetyltransferase